MWQPVAGIEEPYYFMSSYCLLKLHRDRSHLDIRGNPGMTFPLALQHGFISDLDRIMFVSELDMGWRERLHLCPASPGVL
jgi:hypothetical protein